MLNKINYISIDKPIIYDIYKYLNDYLKYILDIKSELLFFILIDNRIMIDNNSDFILYDMNNLSHLSKHINNEDFIIDYNLSIDKESKNYLTIFSDKKYEIDNIEFAINVLEEREALTKHIFNDRIEYLIENIYCYKECSTCILAKGLNKFNILDSINNRLKIRNNLGLETKYILTNFAPSISLLELDNNIDTIEDNNIQLIITVNYDILSKNIYSVIANSKIIIIDGLIGSDNTIETVDLSLKELTKYDITNKIIILAVSISEDDDYYIRLYFNYMEIIDFIYPVFMEIVDNQDNDKLKNISNRIIKLNNLNFNKYK